MFAGNLNNYQYPPSPMMPPSQSPMMPPPPQQSQKQQPPQHHHQIQQQQPSQSNNHQPQQASMSLPQQQYMPNPANDLNFIPPPMMANTSIAMPSYESFKYAMHVNGNGGLNGGGGGANTVESAVVSFENFKPSSDRDVRKLFNAEEMARDFTSVTQMNLLNHKNIYHSIYILFKTQRNGTNGRDMYSDTQNTLNFDIVNFISTMYYKKYRYLFEKYPSLSEWVSCMLVVSVTKLANFVDSMVSANSVMAPQPTNSKLKRNSLFSQTRHVTPPLPVKRLSNGGSIDSAAKRAKSNIFVPNTISAAVTMVTQTLTHPLVEITSKNGRNGCNINVTAKQYPANGHSSRDANNHNDDSFLGWTWIRIQSLLNIGQYALKLAPTDFAPLMIRSVVSSPVTLYMPSTDSAHRPVVVGAKIQFAKNILCSVSITGRKFKIPSINHMDGLGRVLSELFKLTPKMSDAIVQLSKLKDGSDSVDISSSTTTSIKQKFESINESELYFCTLSDLTVLRYANQTMKVSTFCDKVYMAPRDKCWYDERTLSGVTQRIQEYNSDDAKLTNFEKYYNPDEWIDDSFMFDDDNDDEGEDVNANGDTINDETLYDEEVAAAARRNEPIDTDSLMCNTEDLNNNVAKYVKE